MGHIGGFMEKKKKKPRNYLGKSEQNLEEHHLEKKKYLKNGKILGKKIVEITLLHTGLFRARYKDYIHLCCLGWGFFFLL